MWTCNYHARPLGGNILGDCKHSFHFLPITRIVSLYHSVVGGCAVAMRVGGIVSDRVCNLLSINGFGNVEGRNDVIRLDSRWSLGLFISLLPKS